MGEQEKEILLHRRGRHRGKPPVLRQGREAHKAMVLGKKVNIVYDAVQKNDAGQLVAYVYLGGGTSTGTCSTARCWPQAWRSWATSPGTTA